MMEIDGWILVHFGAGFFIGGWCMWIMMRFKIQYLKQKHQCHLEDLEAIDREIEEMREQEN